MRTQSGYMGCIAQLLKKAGTENQGMIVRKDWLEASGVGSLDTMDQYEHYLTYCKDNYGAFFPIGIPFLSVFHPIRGC